MRTTIYKTKSLLSRKNVLRKVQEEVRLQNAEYEQKIRDKQYAIVVANKMKELFVEVRLRGLLNVWDKVTEVKAMHSKISTEGSYTFYHRLRTELYESGWDYFISFSRERVIPRRVVSNGSSYANPLLNTKKK